MSKPLKAPRIQVHGHRGCRGLRPENTLPGFLHALALGVDVLEMDVVISADQQVVVSHDPWLEAHLCRDALGQRIASHNEQAHNLYRLPYETIRRCDCGSWAAPNFPLQLPVSAPKPLLRHVLAAVEATSRPTGTPPICYSIEIKSNPAWDYIFQPSPADFLSLVLAELTTAGVLTRTTLLSFDNRILQLAQEAIIPGLKLCLLTEDVRPWPVALAELGFQPAVFGPNYESVNSVTVNQLREDFPGMALVPWTVNTIPEMQRLISLGVDGITTDYPDKLLDLLNA